MEKEAVAALAHMLGWKIHLGHLTGGGTLANLEALWLARELGGGRRRVLASREAHYTHARMSAVLGMDFLPIEVDRNGRMDPAALARKLDEDVACVVATLGTTAQGAVDPLAEILPLARQVGAWVHGDAAYGGYFKLVATQYPTLAQDFAAIVDCDSVAIDPHKHGLQPYGCGAVLFRDPTVGRVYRHDSPYTYFSSEDLHLGEISLECSRPGAAAVALWATQRLLPLTPEGEFAQGLRAGLAAAAGLYHWVRESEDFVALAPPTLDIVVFGASMATASAASARARAILAAAAARDLHLALLRLPRDLAAAWWPGLAWDAEEVTVLRCCLLKPAHLAWLDAITTRLGAAGEATRTD